MGDAKNLVILQPSRLNNQGFAIASSFTSVSLTVLLAFDTTNGDRRVSSVKSAIRWQIQFIREKQKLN